MAHHAADEVTEAMDRVCAELNHPSDDFTAAAASHTLYRAEW
ncbi:MAG: hypothetical protein ABI833_23060 [Acidobacteriota bacterium]